MYKILDQIESIEFLDWSQGVDDDGKAENQTKINTLRGGRLGGAEGGRTHEHTNLTIHTSTTKTHRSHTKARHFRRLARTTRSHQTQKSTHPIQKQDTVSHTKCVICVSQPEDLAYVVQNWDALPDSVKANICAIVSST